MRFRRIVLAVALMLGTSGTVFALSTPVAQADTCTWPALWEFVSDYAYNQGYYNGEQVYRDATVRLDIDGDGSWFCQGGAASTEWIQWGSNVCLTWNYNAQQIDVITCQGLASQQWALIDPDGYNQLGHIYGGLESEYTNHGDVYMMNNSATAGHLDTAICCWNDSDVFEFTIDQY